MFFRKPRCALANCPPLIAMSLFAMTVSTQVRAADALINFCDFRAASYERLDALLHERIGPMTSATSFLDQFRFQDGFKVQKGVVTAKVLNYSGSIEEGFFKFPDPPAAIAGPQEINILEGGIKCELGNGLADIWSIGIIVGKFGWIQEMELIFMYRDDERTSNFADRGEPLNANYFSGFNGDQVKAVIDLVRDNKYSASELFDIMRTAGFLEDNHTIPNKAAIKAAKPYALQAFNLPLGLRKTPNEESSIGFRVGAPFHENAFPITAITYDPGTDQIIKIERVKSYGPIE